MSCLSLPTTSVPTSLARPSANRLLHRRLHSSAEDVCPVNMETADDQRSPIIIPSPIHASPACILCKTLQQFRQFLHRSSSAVHNSTQGCCKDFLINKCGLTPEEIPKVFRHCNELLRAKSSQNMEEVLKLLNGCGLSTPAQIRRVVICNPGFLFQHAERNVQSKLIFFRTFMKEKDIARLFHNSASTFRSSERKLKAAVSLLQKLGIEGEADA